MNFQSNIKYGDVWCQSMGAVRPDIKGKGIVTRTGIFNVLPGMIGYKYAISEAVNPITIKIHLTRAANVPFFSAKLYDFKDLIFKDGKTMTSIIEQLNTKYKFSKKHVEKMRNSCKQAFGETNYIEAMQVVNNDAPEMDKWMIIKRMLITGGKNTIKASRL